MKEIGGYLEFEALQGRELYPGLFKYNLGRTAIVHYLLETGVKDLYLPYFLCGSVIDAAKEAGLCLHFYHVTADFEPDLSSLPKGRLPEDACLFVLNAYGLIADETVKALRDKYGRVLLDNPHAFFREPIRGVACVYSIRKFFGVPDGAYLSSDRKYPMPEAQDCSRDRFRHLFGRYEEDAGTFYQDMLSVAHGYEGAAPARMSRLTENILKALPYQEIKKVRGENFRTLDAALGRYNRLSALWAPFSGCDLAYRGPFVYPMYVKNGPAVRKALAAEKIFVPTYWSNVMADMPGDSVEYDMAANILALPCDQRYGASDMERIAKSVLALCK